MTDQTEEEEIAKAKEDLGIRLAARSALLDFYGDRAVTFASLFLASIFGIVTTLAVVQNIPRVATCSHLQITLVLLSNAVFVPFAYAGYHSFRKFAMYADFAQKIEEWMEKLALPDEIKVGEAGPNLSKKDVLEKSNKLKLLGSNYFSVFYLLLIILLWAIVYVPVLTQGID
jgi:hypothetical protein